MMMMMTLALDDKLPLKVGMGPNHICRMAKSRVVKFHMQVMIVLAS